MIFMGGDTYKIVNFDEYCKKCEHYETEEHEEPCHVCLNEPVNEYSHKPVKFKEKKK